MDKPWTAPGLSSHERTLLLLGRPTQPSIEEALDAHARDAMPQWTKVEEGLPPEDELGEDMFIITRQDSPYGRRMHLGYKATYGWVIMTRHGRRIIPSPAVECWRKVDTMPEPPREDTK